MREYPDEFPREFWLAIGRLALMALLVVVVFAITRYATRITPEREAELRAEGAAAFDAKVEAAGGWEKWLEGEIACGVRGAPALPCGEVAQ